MACRFLGGRPELNDSRRSVPGGVTSKGAGAQFPHTFPANSFTILRFKTAE
jgi:hypothetical protein